MQGPSTRPSRSLLLRFLVDEGGLKIRETAALVLLVSAASVTTLIAINIGAQQLQEQGRDEVNWVLAALFGSSVILQYVGQSRLIASVSTAMEAGIDRVRMRLVEGVRRADFAWIERTGSDVLYEGITQTSNALSQNSLQIALSLGSAGLTTLILGYIFYLSVPAFTIVVCGATLGGWLYHRLGTRLRAGYAQMLDHERHLFASVGDLLDGFREVRMWSRRSQALRAQFGAASERATDARLDVQAGSITLMIFGQAALFFLLALVVFVLPAYLDTTSDDLIKVTAAVVFLIGPMGGTIQAVSVMAGARAAAERMLALDALLAAMRDPADAPNSTGLNANFREIELAGIRYTYHGAAGAESAFRLDPIHLLIRRGEVLFITGGNGSGKTTFLKLLTGLYRPEAGAVRVDGATVTDANRQAYRELFGAVWSGQHLSRRLHGLGSPDSDHVQELLQWMEMHDKIALHGDQLDRTQLSAGQKKRVQLVAALLEGRSLLILDEWAADQDPTFRRKFYREVIPELRQRGITVIAVTHDEPYFDAADRRIHFEQGRLIEVPPSSTRAS